MTMKPCKRCGVIPPMEQELEFEEPTGYWIIKHFCGMAGQEVRGYGQSNMMRERNRLQEGKDD